MDFSGCDYLWRQRPDLPRRLIKGVAEASGGKVSSSLLWTMMTSPSSMTGADIHQSWFPGSRRRCSTPPSDWKHQSLCYRATTLTSGREKNTRTQTHRCREVPRRSPSGNGNSPLSRIRPAPCLVISPPFLFVGHLRLLFPRPLRHTWPFISELPHHSCLSALLRRDRKSQGCLFSGKKRNSSSFISKNRILALRPNACLEERELAWQHYLPQTPHERINHHQWRSPDSDPCCHLKIFQFLEVKMELWEHSEWGDKARGRKRDKEAGLSILVD